MGHTDIPYCDCTWDLTIGCRKRSPGCANCWATRTVHRLAAKLPAYRGQTTEDGKDWLPTGCPTLLACNLGLVLGWRGGRFIFVNSKSDLFDERVPFAFITRVWGAMAMGSQHKYMILTKEPGRLAQFIAQYQQAVRVPAWPNDFPHVILMTSVEGPEQFHRWITLSRIPAQLRGISLEPLLQPIAKQLTPWITQGLNYCHACGWYGEDDGDELHGPAFPCPACGEETDAIPLDEMLDWIVVGCEKLAGGRAGRWAAEDPTGWWNDASMIRHHAALWSVPVWMKQGPYYRNGKVFVSDMTGDWATDCRIQQHPRWPGSRTGSD
jgi:protein gp37